MLMYLSAIHMKTLWSDGQHLCQMKQHTGQMQHCVSKKKKQKKNKTHKPVNLNFATVQTKVMMLRYSLEDSSVSHPQPNLRYSTVGLPLHPRGCLLRACEAQWTEFQWADSFFCLSIRMYTACAGAALRCMNITIWQKQNCWDTSFLHSSASISPCLSLPFSGRLYVFPLLSLSLFPSPLSSLWALFLFLPSLAVYKGKRHAPIGWLVSLSQRCHYWNPTGLMLIYTHRWAPKQR